MQMIETRKDSEWKDGSSDSNIYAVLDSVEKGGLGPIKDSIPEIYLSFSVNILLKFYL